MPAVTDARHLHDEHGNRPLDWHHGSPATPPNGYATAGVVPFIDGVLAKVIRHGYEDATGGATWITCTNVQQFSCIFAGAGDSIRCLRRGTGMNIENIHVQLWRARRANRASERTLAMLLWQLQRSGQYTERGHSSVVQYAEVELDLTPRQTQELVALARRLAVLPALDAAFAAGEVGWTKLREITKVATPETDAAWAERAKTVTSRELETLVAHTPAGGAPPAPGAVDTAARRRRRLVYDLEAADAEIVERALRMLRLAGEHGAETPPAELLVEMARRLLASEAVASVPAPTAAGERYRVVLHTCAECGRDPHVGAADKTAAALSSCDAERVDARPAAHGELTHRVPPAVRRRVIHRQGDRCAVPYCRHRHFIDIHHIVPRAVGETTDERGLVGLCPMHHMALHRGALSLWVTDGGELHFLHADGQRFGPGAEPLGSFDAAPDAAERLLATVESKPGRGLRDLGTAAGLSPWRALHLLNALAAEGDVFESPHGEWFRVSQMMEGARAA